MERNWSIHRPEFSAGSTHTAENKALFKAGYYIEKNLLTKTGLDHIIIRHAGLTQW